MNSTIEYDYVDHLPADFSDRELRADVRAGLLGARKSLPPKWFYDKVGSELFEDITRLPEYYPTRTERAILDPACRRHRAGRRHPNPRRTRIGFVGQDPAAAGCVDLSGRQDGGSYVALDVSEDALRSACAALARTIRRCGSVGCGPTSPISWIVAAGRRPDRRLPRRHDRQLRAGGTGRVPAIVAGRPGNADDLPARRRPGQTGRRSGAGLRRRRRGDRRVQPEPARRAEPPAGSRFRPHRLRSHRRLGRRQRMDRDASSGSRT